MKISITDSGTLLLKGAISKKVGMVAGDYWPANFELFYVDKNKFTVRFFDDHGNTGNGSATRK